MSDQSDLATTVARLDSTVEHLASTVKTLSDRVERMRGANWSAIGVLAAIAIPTVGGLTWGFVTRMEASENRIDRESARLTVLINTETERNNKIEREMGGVMKVNELYMQGMLRNPESAKP